jgi:hypothetical protein
MMLPLVQIPETAARLVWYTLNAIGLVVLVRGAWSLSGGRRLEGESPARRREHFIAGLGLLCSAAYLLDAITNQQNDLIVAALVIGGCQLIVQGRGVLAGLVFGLATGIKCTPLLLAAYLLYRRQWAGAVLVPVVAIGINLLPDLTHPPKNGDARLVTWSQRFLVPMSAEEHEVGTWATAIDFNHSLNGVLSRLFLLERGWQPGEQRPPAQVGPVALRAIAASIMLALLTAALACSGLADRRLGRHTLQAGPPPSRQSLEFSLVLILMLLMSPQSSKPHFCTLVLPAFCLAQAALGWPSRPLLVLVLLAMVLGLASNKDLVGKFVYDWLKWYGGMTAEALILFAGCCLALLQKPPAETVAN